MERDNALLHTEDCPQVSTCVWGACLCMCVCACICACTYTIPGPLDSFSSQTLTNGGTVTFAISEVGGGWPGYWVLCWQRLRGIIKFLSEIKDVQCMVVHGFFLTTGRQSHMDFCESQVSQTGMVRPCLKQNKIPHLQFEHFLSFKR